MLATKPLEGLTEAADVAVEASRPSDDLVKDEEATVSTNGDARYPETIAPVKTAPESEPTPVLDVKVESVPPPVSQRKPPSVPPEPESKSTPPVQQHDKSRDVEKHTDPQLAEKVKKRQNALTRTIWTFIMIGGFLGMSLEFSTMTERLISY